MIRRLPLTRLVSYLLLLVSTGWSRADGPSRPSAQPGLEQRVRDLEAVILKLRAERERGDAVSAPPPVTDSKSNRTDAATNVPTEAVPLPDAARARLAEAMGSAAGEMAKEEPSPVAGWNNGFFLQSKDKDFVLRITGQIQADYREFLRAPDETDIDMFLVRRARLGIEATMFRYYEFRLLPDFGQGQSRVQDAYLNVHYWDQLQLEMGKFKQPFSYEQLIQDRFVPTLERSMIDQLVPARDVGIMVHGQKLLEDRLDYAFAVSNGEINGDSDTNDAKDVAARVAVRPFNSPQFGPAFHGLQLGIAVRTGIEQEPINPSILRTPATVLWFQFNPTVRADGLRTAWSPEVAYFNGPFGFAAQYLWENQDMRSGLPGVAARRIIDVPFKGWYVLATCLLTGEERTTYSQPIDPRAPFDPICGEGGPGAWELVARVSQLSIGEEVFLPGPVRLADPNRYTNKATELTLGFNWYLNRWVRMQFNWEHAWFDDPVQLSPDPTRKLRGQDTLLTRFQVIF